MQYDRTRLIAAVTAAGHVHAGGKIRAGQPSAAAVANALGVSAPTAWRLLSGATKPDGPTAIRVQAVYGRHGVKAADLYVPARAA